MAGFPVLTTGRIKDIGDIRDIRVYGIWVFKKNIPLRGIKIFTLINHYSP